MRPPAPILAIAAGSAGVLACLLAALFAFAKTRKPRLPDPGTIPPDDLNRNMDLARYRPTSDSIIFLDKDLPGHPFKIGDGGVFCSECLINTQLKRPAGPISFHDHACTVTGKDWKLVICRDGSRVGYFVSLDHPHLRRGR